MVLLDTKCGRSSDKARKYLTHAFNKLGLNITAQANQLSTNFLDITFELSNGTYKPYGKPNDEPLYINRHSNHPAPIIRQLPISVNKRINSSCNKEVFYHAAPLYNHAVKQSNFDFSLHHEPPPAYCNTSTRRNRQRHVIWFNPPYSKNVKTNIARDFLRLLDKHFPPSHKLNNIFNRHTVRISYSCTDNMKSFLDKHNKIILKKHINTLNSERLNKDGSCVLKASVDRVSVDTLGRYVDRQSADMSTDSRSIYRPILGRYVGRDSVDISADCRSTRMSGDTLRYFTATRPTLGRYFTDTRPALRSFGQLFLLSSIFSTQVLDNLF